MPEVERDHKELEDSLEELRGVSRLSTDMIVASCFLDDVLVLFLFNSGRYLIVSTFSTQPQQKTQHAQQKTQNNKSSLTSSQIVYQGSILQQLKATKSNQKQQNQQQISFTPPKKLLPKNSLTFIEQSYSKVIFCECKRIQSNECIVITKHSANVYWLRLVKQGVQKSEDLTNRIRTQIYQLPGTMVGDILRMDNTHSSLNMTVLTQLCEFDNSAETEKYLDKKETSNKDNKLSNKGSFYIKNEILEDKMVYLTIYTRVPQEIRQKYTKGKHSQQQSQLFQKQLNTQELKLETPVIPYFIITKFEFPIPINEFISNFVIQVSDNYNNEIAIYKQTGDDENEWEIKLYNFGFDDVGGEDTVFGYLNNIKERKKTQGFSSLVIQNNQFIPKPKIIILPQEFTSSIHIQQFILLNHQQQKSCQATYLIISINQTFVEAQELTQNQINEQQQGQAYRVNGELVYLDQNGHVRPRQNTIKSNYCWAHLCKLTFQQNSDQFTQWIQKSTKYKFQSNSFLKIINVNYHQQLLYVLQLAHQRVNNQLYENKLDLISIQTGKIIQKGYLSLKNFSFSPNQTSILDQPQTFSTQENFFFHIRLLFYKKSLYTFMIENSKKYFGAIHDVNFVQTILSLL